MRLGFGLFGTPSSARRVHEVFPTASYELLGRETFKLSIDLRGIADGPKDFLDSYIAAATVKEFTQGQGAEVGGGDGLGTIVLPRPILGASTELLTWPR